MAKEKKNFRNLCKLLYVFVNCVYGQAASLSFNKSCHQSVAIEPNVEECNVSSNGDFDKFL